MLANITMDGTLVITTQFPVEEYVLVKWYQDACDGKTQLRLEVNTMEGEGNLTLGPQQVELKALKKGEK